jgi:hypothetical protein
VNEHFTVSRCLPRLIRFAAWATTNGKTAVVAASRTGINVFSPNKATASDFWAMFFIMVTDSQAIEGNVFSRGRDEFSPETESLTNCRSSPGGVVVA